MGYGRRAFLELAGASVAVASVPTTVSAAQPDYRTVRVPTDQPTVQAGVDAAGEGDLVLVEPGTYEEAVAVTTPGVTLRGEDRNAVVLDGGFERTNGVDVDADGVAVENLTVRRFQANGVYWAEVEGFRGSYLTAYNNGDYGVYATHSRDGRFEACYASGHPDAGFYLGRSQPFVALVTDCVAERNSWGYSGTSAGGDLTVRDSTFRANQAGIVPNTLDTQAPPEQGTRIANNEVVDNDNEDAPTKQFTYPAFGTGILLWGGSGNLVQGNRVRGHANFGVAAAKNVVVPSGNLVTGNTVSGSGVADLALAVPTGTGNEFSDNEFATALPSGIEQDASLGSAVVANVFDEQRAAARDGNLVAGDWRTQPEPERQESMADPGRAPAPASKDGSVME